LRSPVVAGLPFCAISTVVPCGRVVLGWSRPGFPQSSRVLSPLAAVVLSPRLGWGLIPRWAVTPGPSPRRPRLSLTHLPVRASHSPVCLSSPGVFRAELSLPPSGGFAAIFSPDCCPLSTEVSLPQPRCHPRLQNSGGRLASLTTEPRHSQPVLKGPGVV
jgi:hypothetical protein